MLDVVVVLLAFVAEHHVFIAGLVVTVAHVDTFRIHHIGIAAIDLGIGNRVVAGVGDGRSAQGIVGVGVGQVAGGVDGAVERLAHCGGTGLSKRADPQNRID